MAEEATGQPGEGDKKIVHTYPLVKVILFFTKFISREKSKKNQEK